MFQKLIIMRNSSIYLQIKNYVKELILKGLLQGDEKLPSTRELCSMLKVSRNSCIKAYEELEQDGFIYLLKSKGAYVQNINLVIQNDFNLDWKSRVSVTASIAEEYDLIKTTIKTEKKVISFRGLSPDKNLFDIEGFKRSFLNIIQREGSNLLNYGYAKGYKPLINYLLKYMTSKGVNIENKDILITNGFTEGFDIVLNTITEVGDGIICENPTHNTAIKIMKINRLNIHGIDMEEDGLNIDMLREKISKNKIKVGYLVPSYHNPTGIVMSAEKRLEVYKIFKENNIPIIEDGFNEELRYSGAHIAPISAFTGLGNGVIYIGSFSKILFPGLRVGWVLADKNLISALESVKKSRNIHTSFIDQGILFQYLQEGNFEKTLRKSRKIYSERYDFAIFCAEKYITYEKITGAGGMNIFITLSEDINAKQLLEQCYERGVIFMPGNIFYVSDPKENTLRIGFANVTLVDIEKGFKIIGECVENYEGWKKNE